MSDSSAISTCRHCGSPVPDPAPEPGFCCRGCAYVYNLIHDGGLSHFYDLKGGESVQPVLDKAFTAHDWTWLQTRIADAESSLARESKVGQDSPSPITSPRFSPNRSLARESKVGETSPPPETSPPAVATLETGIDGVSCVGCLWLIENLFTKCPGSLACETHPGSGWIRLTWHAGKCDIAGFARTLQQFGYLLTPKVSKRAVSQEASDLRLRLGLCSAFAMNAMAFTLPFYLGMDPSFFLAGLFEQITALSATLALLVGGSYFIKRAWLALGQGLLHMDFPIALGVVLAWVGSMIGWLAGHDALIYFDFVALFLTLMLAGRLMQVAALERHRQRARGLETVPDEATLPGGATKALDDLTPGEVVEIQPGGLLPVGGVLENTRASVSLEWINGEAEPQAWNQGRRLPAGAINVGRDPILVRTAESWDDSLLKRLAEAGERKSESRPLLEKILRAYVIIVVALAFIGGLVWFFISEENAWVNALQVAVSVLVVSCPCAIGLALPLADDLSRAALQRHGIFLRRSDFFSRFAAVRSLVFDKTGTLTMERPELVNPEAIDQLPPDARHRLRDLVSSSLHPASRRLLEALAESPGDNPPDVAEIPGQGLRLTAPDGTSWTLGHPGFAAADPSPDWADTALRRDGNFVAGFRFRDALRPESREAIDWLRKRGFHIAMLSGDRPEKVAAVAEQLGIPTENALARLSPEAKRDWVQAHDPTATRTLFLGDGANDSFACAAAACSGTPMIDRALLEEKADFFFTGRSLGFLPRLFQVAEIRRGAVRRAFLFAVCYNAGAVSLCLAGLMHPLVAAVVMPLGSLISVARVAFAFRLRRNPVPAAPQPAPDPAASAA